MKNPEKSHKSTGYKTLFDMSLLIGAHIALLPVWILLWTVIPISIWISDRGPVFYRQRRVGKNGQVFTLLKFRTMTPDADRSGPAWTSVDDPRITHIGKFLRRTALDELPGVISIFRGHMSFVGPRALDLEEQNHLEFLIPGFDRRLQITPGLTGLAQVYDKNDDPYDKLRYDIEYLERLGPMLDIKLIIMSIWNTLIARWDHRSGKDRLNKSRQHHSETQTKVDD